MQRKLNNLVSNLLSLYTICVNVNFLIISIYSFQIDSKGFVDFIIYLEFLKEQYHTSLIIM